MLYIKQKNHILGFINIFLGSSFWEDFARPIEEKGWTEEEFIDNIKVYITDKAIDSNLKKDLKNLYKYAKGVKPKK